MSNVVTVYDEMQHCTSTIYPQEKSVATDCPYTGKGEEFSPGNLVESALAGCMLISMGTLAMRNDIDITGTKVEVELIGTDKPVMRYKEIKVNVTMARDYSEKDRIRLERAADSCPIKHSFDNEIEIKVKYNYPQ